MTTHVKKIRMGMVNPVRLEEDQEEEDQRDQPDQQQDVARSALLELITF